VEAGIPARLTPFTAAEGRKFAFPVGAAFLVLAAIAFWRHPQAVPWKVLATLGGLLLVSGVVLPAQLGPVYRGWMGFAKVLSKITTPIFMGVVYYVVVTPIGVGMRLFGRQPMRHKEQAGGFWTAPPSGGRSDMTHQF
jgi:hypothetical protein